MTHTSECFAHRAPAALEDGCWGYFDKRILGLPRNADFVIRISCSRCLGITLGQLSRRVVLCAASLLVLSAVLIHPRQMCAQEVSHSVQQDGSRLRDELSTLMKHLTTYADRSTMGGRMGYAGQSPAEGLQLARAVRLLHALPADEQYARLKQWVLPSKPGEMSRGAMCYAPVEVPGEEFFSDLKLSVPDRAERAAAPITPGYDGVIYFGELLVEAAAKCGKLDELASITKAAANNQPMVETLYLLTIFASRDGDPLAQQARQFVAAWKQATSRPDPSELKPWPTHMIARAWMRHDQFCAAGEQLAQMLATQAAVTSQTALLSCLLRDQAWGRVREQHGTMLPGADPQLALWQPGGYYYHSGANAGTWPDWWVEHDGVIVHLSGPEISPLYFSFPIAGEFELSVDGYVADEAEAAVQYGRFLLEPRWRGKSARVLTIGEREMSGSTDEVATLGEFNRFVIRVAPAKVSYLCNDHVVYEDDQPSPTTPWLALLGRSTRRTAWRNLHLTGSPVVPQQVTLVEGDHLEGWLSPLYRESLPRQIQVAVVNRSSSTNSAASRSNCAWYAVDGVLHGPRMKIADRTRAIQSWLAYHRPLQPGDRLSYEFYYQPGEKTVYPSLGRIALLLEPNGVKLHWITEIPHMAIGGLASDNTAVPTAQQRGAKPPPLRPNQWNQVAIEMTDAGAIILLNGQRIYQHPMAPADNHVFGFFRYANRSTAEVRAITLRGDWPRQLSREQLTHPFVRRTDNRQADDQSVRAALTDPSWVLGNLGQH